MFLLWQCFEAQISLSLSQMLSSAGNAIPDSKAFLCSSNFTFTWQGAASSTCTKLSMSAHFANHKAQFFRHNSRNECLTREPESGHHTQLKVAFIVLTWPKGGRRTPQILCLLPAEQFCGAIEQLFGILNNYLVAGRIVMTVSQARTRGDFWWWISMMLIRFHCGYTLNVKPDHLEVDISYMIHIYVYVM